MLRSRATENGHFMLELLGMPTYHQWIMTNICLTVIWMCWGYCSICTIWSKKLDLFSMLWWASTLQKAIRVLTTASKMSLPCDRRVLLFLYLAMGLCFIMWCVISSHHILFMLYCFQGLASCFNPLWCILGRYCGSTIPHPITSFSDTLLVNFISNDVHSSRGFRAIYAASMSGRIMLVYHLK